MKLWPILAYNAVALATFVFLTFFDGYHYTWWNWIIAIPANIFFGEIWPVYWLIILPLSRFAIEPLFARNHLIAAVALFAGLLLYFAIMARGPKRR